MNKTFTRAALVLLALILTLTALVGCTKTVEESSDIAFTYFMPGTATVFDHGQTTYLQVIAINEGNHISYTGAGPQVMISASLVIEHEGKTYRIAPKEDAIADDATARVWEKGDQATRGFNFVIPADAPVGHYDLEVATSTASRTFEDVLEVHIHTPGASHTPSTGHSPDDGHGH